MRWRAVLRASQSFKVTQNRNRRHHIGAQKSTGPHGKDSKKIPIKSEKDVGIGMKKPAGHCT